jgi:hypothetical protein
MPPRLSRWRAACDKVETTLEEIARHFEYNRTAPRLLHRCAGNMRTRSLAHRRCGRFLVEAEPVVVVGAVEFLTQPFRAQDPLDVIGQASDRDGVAHPSHLRRRDEEGGRERARSPAGNLLRDVSLVAGSAPK